MTVQELIEKFNELGALQCKLEMYDTERGYMYEVGEVYTRVDDEDIVCIDLKVVD